MTVDIDGYGPLEVVGKGALIVRREMRGRGLSTRIIDRVAELTRELGPDVDMAFCEPALIDLYGHQGYHLIEDPIWVEQPGGPVRWPLSAIWRPIRDGPAGRRERSASAAFPSDGRRAGSRSGRG